VDIPTDFHERFCLETLPYYYKNNQDANYDYGPILDPTDVCMPALWCEQPPDWEDVSEVQISNLTIEGPRARDRVKVEPGGLRLSLAHDESVCITPVNG
jgi:hypothetical protein